MTIFRRDFLKLASTGLAGATAGISLGAHAQTASMPGAGASAVFDVKSLWRARRRRLHRYPGDQQGNRGGQRTGRWNGSVSLGHVCLATPFTS